MLQAEASKAVLAVATGPARTFLPEHHFPGEILSIGASQVNYSDFHCLTYLYFILIVSRLGSNLDDICRVSKENDIEDSYRVLG